MVGELLEMRREISPVERLEHFPRAGVQLHALHRGQVLIQRLANQRMPEAVLANTSSLLIDQAGANGRGQLAGRLAPTQAMQLRQRRKVEAPAKDCRNQ